MLSILRQTVKDFVADECPTLAAALAYYTVFSLPPLLFIIIVVAGFIVGRDTVQAAVRQQAEWMMGGAASTQVGAMASTARAGVAPQVNLTQTDVAALVGLAISIAGVVFGATTAFAQLQEALNRSWKVRSASGGIRGFIIKRVLSFAILLLIGVLVLASFTLSTWAVAAGSLFGAPWWAIEAATFGVSFIVLFTLFAIIFKYFPDAVIDWSDVRVGAFITAGLFEIGRFFLGMYLGKTATASLYGAAGSLALVLLFVYYASMIVLLGAEFTQVWARSAGKDLRPARGAVVIRHAVEVRR